MANFYASYPFEGGGGGGGGGVTSLNGESGAVVLLGGTGISVTPVGQNITITNTSPSSGGTVTSVALTTPGVLYSVSGSPITTSGTLAMALISQAQNSVLAGPTSGSGNPSFRSLVAADIPSLPFTQITGTVPITQGGTGQTTANAGFNALSPMTTQYDLIIGGISGVATRLAAAAGNAQLTSTSGVVAWTSVPSPYLVSTISSNTAGVSGTTYLCNTSGAGFTVTLPVPVSGAFIAIKDSTGSFGTNQLTVAQHSSEMIEGLAASKILYTNWGAWSFFSDGTNWFMGPF